MKLTSSKLIALQLSALLLMSTQVCADEFNVDDLPDVVLLDIYADYCSPCRQMVPLLQKMEKSGFPIRKVDFQTNSDLCKNYFNALALPTLIVMVEGKEVQRFEGFTSEATLRQAMNNASRELHAQRQQSRNQLAKSDAPSGGETVADDTPANSNTSRTGLAGFFDRFKSSGGAATPANEFTDADFRAQSPDESPTAQERNSIPHKATVRVRLMDGKMRDVGTGTVIHSVPGLSTILTCAHIFKDAAPDAVVEVDVFQGDKTLNYPATVLGGDHNADVALLQIKTSTILPSVTLGFDRPALQRQESLFSIGCSNGDPPSRLKMNVVGVDMVVNAPSNILCTNAPKQGRSGGGLFDLKNRLVGVCSAADYKAGEGLYGGLPPVRELMKRLKLTSLLQQPVEQFDGMASQSEATRSQESPFPTDGEVFDELFGQAPATEPASQTAQVTPNFNGQQNDLRDPFGSATTQPTSTGSEITVIIKDPTAPNGQKVVVIPKASPWLLKLLTGESQVAANTPSQLVQPTSRRQSVVQEDFDSSAPFFQ